MKTAKSASWIVVLAAAATAIGVGCSDGVVNGNPGSNAATAGSTQGGAPVGGGSSSSGAGGVAVGGNTGGTGSGGTPASGGSSGTSTGGNSGSVGQAGSPSEPLPDGHFQMENLNRGVVAVEVDGGVYVGWRMFGYEYDQADPSRISYKLYRDGTLVADVTDSTNYLDPDGGADSEYSVHVVIDGQEQNSSETATAWAGQYLRIPLQVPTGGTTPDDVAYTYSANDASVGDVDGDGQYEIFLKWDPSNAHDNSQSGYTGNVYMDVYRLDGTRLWRVDLGRNIRAGAHYTQFVVYDFDGDGKAEMAVKTAPGTKDGTGKFLSLGPAASDDDNADYRASNGYVLSGPEYVTVFDGATGAELATAAFAVPRGTVNDWGDNYGNRVDRFLASAAFVSDLGSGQDASGRPSFLMARGYYTRATITAWNYRDGALTEVWTADSNDSTAYAGQGAHSMAVADVDGDGAQEIAYGAATVDSDGTRKCTTGYNHGDALHVGDFVPTHAGIEIFMCNEDGKHPAYHVRDGATCEIIQEGPINGADTGRCVADDVSPDNPGAEMWASSVDGFFSATTDANLGAKPPSQNFLIWWDADETREVLDGNKIDKYKSSGSTRLLTADGVSSNNGTKSTPALTADILGDWREEVLWRETNSSALRLYTTTNVTGRRIYTLMHDPQYRMQISSEQTAYNQPPHPSFQIGNGMAEPPEPDINVK